MISCASAISTRPPCAAIMPMPATCPADVRFVIEMRIAASGGMPIVTAVIPNVKDTERYPSAIGSPPCSPSR